ncbi:MAG: RNA polymerase sigma factor [Acidobacteria bacterium]|nr:RNA polymerase sigma factor [Acidobacteriota bacterium]
MQLTTDEALLVRAGKGCEHSFATLYRKFQGAVYRYALQMCSSDAVAQDVTQEVFLAVLAGNNRYNVARGAALPYLMGIARNQVFSWIRRRQPWVSLEEDGNGSCAIEPPHDAALEREDTTARLRRAIAALPPVYREVVVLCDLEEMDYAQAAQTLGVAIGTVRSRLHRARALLMTKCVERKCPA